jgi:hypothetical protein
MPREIGGLAQWPSPATVVHGATASTPAMIA